MLKPMAEMEAIPVSLPHMTSVLNPVTLNEDEHLGYEAEIQYKRKRTYGSFDYVLFTGHR